MARLRDICEIVSGTTPKTNIPEYWGGEINWITPAEIDEHTQIIFESERKITNRAVQSGGLSPFPAGTVILSSRAPIGKVAIAGVEMYCNQGFKNLICSEVIYNKYLYWFLKSKTDYLNSLGRGATFKEISKEIVGNINVPLPSLEEQHCIADLMDKISSLISLRKQQLAKLDELVKERFVEMFGDPVTNPRDLDVVSLSKIAEFYNGLTYTPSDVSKDGTIVLRSSNIQNGMLDFNDTVRVSCTIKNKYMVQENDILMCSRNGSARLVGKVAPISNISEPMCFGAFMMIVRSKYAPYLLTYFRTDAFREQIKTGATTTINQITVQMLGNVYLPIPIIQEVEEYSGYLNLIEKCKLTIQQGLDKLEMLKKALMQEYFGG